VVSGWIEFQGQRHVKQEHALLLLQEGAARHFLQVFDGDRKPNAYRRHLNWCDFRTPARDMPVPEHRPFPAGSQGQSKRWRDGGQVALDPARFAHLFGRPDRPGGTREAAFARIRASAIVLHR
jgi:hypothetical protein